MATNTYKTFLMYSSAGTTYNKLIDIKETPDLGQAPDTLDTTTLSDAMKTYINDIKDTGGALEFTANYDYAEYTTLKAMEGTTYYFSIWFGGEESDGELVPDGSLGKFTFQGELSCWPKAASVSAVREMGISIAPSTEIEFA